MIFYIYIYIYIYIYSCEWLLTWRQQLARLPRVIKTNKNEYSPWPLRQQTTIVTSSRGFCVYTSVLYCTRSGHTEVYGTECFNLAYNAITRSLRTWHWINLCTCNLIVRGDLSVPAIRQYTSRSAVYFLNSETLFINDCRVGWEKLYRSNESKFALKWNILLWYFMTGTCHICRIQYQILAVNN